MTADGLVVLAADDPRWDEVLAGTAHDLHHHQGYHGLAQWNGEGQPFLALFERDGARLAWPYLLRPIAGTDAVDVGCVYGYPGPVAAGIDDMGEAEARSFVAGAWAALTSTWHDLGVVSAVTTFNPLLGNVRLAEACRADPAGPEPIIVPGRTVSIDLGPRREERLAAYEKETRYEIGRARRAGLSTTIDAAGTHLPDLARLYADTMGRNDAAERYRFTAAYFDRLWGTVVAGSKQVAECIFRVNNRVGVGKQ